MRVGEEKRGEGSWSVKGNREGEGKYFIEINSGNVEEGEKSHLYMSGVLPMSDPCGV